MQNERILELTNIKKRFGGVQALGGVNLEVGGGGEIHALLGANGSGKSTLLKIASGQLQPDAGTIKFDGVAARLMHPRAAVQLGIATVTQEVTLAPDLTVVENILLGRLLKNKWGLVDWSASRLYVEKLLDEMGLADLPLNLPVKELRPDQQQIVEIVRACSRKARLIILDEATSSLSGEQVEKIFRILARLSDMGISILLVSHRMREIFELASRVTVLRDGHTVAVRSLKSTDTAQLVADMTGNPLVDKVAVDGPARANEGASPGPEAGHAPPRVAVRGLTAPGLFHDVSFDVRQGEILALTGLAQSGVHDVIESIYGSDRGLISGSVAIDGASMPLGSVPRSIRAGIGMVPADRKHDGILLQRSVAENLNIVNNSDRFRFSLANVGRESQIATSLRGRFAIKSENLATPAGQLSGGNQQKIVIAKWFVDVPKVLLLVEPTRGVDISSKLQIYDLLRQLSANGTTIIFASGEVDEILQIATRIIVMFRGAVVADHNRDEMDEQRIIALGSGLSISGDPT